MASPRLVVDGNTSRAAIMINADPGDTAANIADPSFANPLAHFGDWKWAGHPDVDYLGIVSAHTISVNLDPDSGGWTGVDYSTDANGRRYYYSYSRTLLTHGLGYTPVTVATASVSGHVIPLSGDGYLRINGAGVAFEVEANVYADSNKITFFVRIPYYNTGPTITVTVYLCNMGIDGSGNLVRPPLNSGFDASGSRLRCGRFDTNYGYFYKDTNGAIPIYRGRSMEYGIGRLPNDSSVHALGWAYNVNGYSITKYATLPTTDDVGWSWPGTSTSAASILKISAAMPATAPSLDASSGRIRFGNVLDTNRNMFLISNAILNKTITIPSRHVQKTGSYVDETLTYNLGTVHPNATDVIGLVTINGKTRSLGGTHVIYTASLPMRGYRYQEQTGNVSQLAVAMFFYIAVSGGKLVMTVKRKIPRLVFDRTYLGAAVTVNALVGAFDY